MTYCIRRGYGKNINRHIKIKSNGLLFLYADYVIFIDVAVSRYSNFCKDITIIKIKLKNDESYDNLKNKGIYYNLFNLRKFSFKKEENCLYLYEIMYDSVSEEDIKIIKDSKLKK